MFSSNKNIGFFSSRFKTKLGFFTQISFLLQRFLWVKVIKFIGLVTGIIALWKFDLWVQNCGLAFKWEVKVI